MVKTITDDFNYCSNVGITLEAATCLLKLQLFKHRNSIYFMRDILKSDHIPGIGICEIFCLQFNTNEQNDKYLHIIKYYKD